MKQLLAKVLDKLPSKETLECWGVTAGLALAAVLPLVLTLTLGVPGLYAGLLLLGVEVVWYLVASVAKWTDQRQRLDDQQYQIWELTKALDNLVVEQTDFSVKMLSALSKKDKKKKKSKKK